MYNKDNLYKTVNNMSLVKFCINEDLLNYLENEGKYLNIIDENPSEELQKLTTLQVAKTYLNIPLYLPLQAD